MGVKSLLGVEPVKLAKDLMGDLADKQRKETQRRRLDLYHDDTAAIVQSDILKVFDSAEVRGLVKKVLGLAGSQGLFRRIVNEISRPVYSIPPVRRVDNDTDMVTYLSLAKECRLNAKMDLACRVVHAANAAFLYVRYLENLGRINVDVISPDMVSVIEHPEDPTEPLAILYQAWVWRGEQKVNVWIYWDDEVTFRMQSEKVIAFDDGDVVKTHGLGMVPFVPIHRQERAGQYWDVTTGQDLEAAQLSLSFLMALILRLHKTQGYRQMYAIGDLQQIPKAQLLAEESMPFFPEGTQVGTMDIATDPGHYLKTVEQVITQVAANHGINRDRLNQKSEGLPSEVGLLERRADAIKVFREAETRLFDVVRRVVNREYPGKSIGEDARFEIDFSEVEARVDRMTQLKIWAEEEKMGLRNHLDNVMEDQPEIQSPQEAEREYMRNIEYWQRRINMLRQMNSPQDMLDNGVGRTPQENGRLGPAARDNGADAPDSEEVN